MRGGRRWWTRAWTRRWLSGAGRDCTELDFGISAEIIILTMDITINPIAGGASTRLAEASGSHEAEARIRSGSILDGECVEHMELGEGGKVVQH